MLLPSSDVEMITAALKMDAAYSSERLLCNQKTARNTEDQYATHTVELTSNPTTFCLSRPPFFETGQK
jgi:hypothetical protein